MVHDFNYGISSSLLATAIISTSAVATAVIVHTFGNERTTQQART